MEPRPQPERQPQWSREETSALLTIRAEFHQSFMETKRNKPLWETVSLRMHQRGFPRSGEQCKSKWKNLLVRFKGSESMETETSKKFPFQEEMQKILSERMERSEDDDADEGKRTKRRREEGGEDVVQVVGEIARRQLEMEEKWMKEVEENEEERRVWEEDWRRSMEGLLLERMETERRWREMEEERREREEARAEKRHQLLTAIVSKLVKKDS